MSDFWSDPLYDAREEARSAYEAGYDDDRPTRAEAERDAAEERAARLPIPGPEPEEPSPYAGTDWAGGGYDYEEEPF